MANLFFSYSHKDEELRNELEVHLSMLKRQGLLQSWHDRRIGAGKDIHSNISAELEGANIILLLVSANFLASDYCYNKEMARALEKDKEGTSRVIPVILHPCDWHSAPFGHLRATPEDGKPVSMFANRDEALAQVAKDIRITIEELGPSVQDESVLHHPESAQDAGVSFPRSSNLRVKKRFTDQEVDEFLESSFEYICRYFEASLSELQTRNQNITTKYKRIDANCFTASIYDEGARASECTIWSGGDQSFIGGIAYYGGITTSRNQYNESLSVENDGYSLHLKSMGMSDFGMREKSELSQEGAAEFYWGLLIERLQ
ncbi:MAG: toll/interleukin-1 receptor domain-containing protein [Candidatus Thiodiazotropha taylori]|nr:toll/interleukin-1 receptor domain-containing protein [Candidatus Thiodiazotropha endolucinida]MCW4228502.1 toll/interleukin-1 receptor domain-containing protein [Candidatus Thiodiazotropha taylori]